MQCLQFKNYLFLSNQRHQIGHTSNIGDARISTQACRIAVTLREMFLIHNLQRKLSLALMHVSN